jgi:hypothetical protein
MVKDRKEYLRDWARKNKASRALSKRKYYQTNAGKLSRKKEIERGLSAAGLAVNRALKRGVIFRKNICAACFKEEITTHFHHFKGYAKENYLDVVELCELCHKEAHAEPDHQFHPRVGLDLSIPLPVML